MRISKSNEILGPQLFRAGRPANAESLERLNPGLSAAKERVLTLGESRIGTPASNPGRLGDLRVIV